MTFHRFSAALALAAMLLASLPAGAASQSDYRNGDGTHTPAVVPLLPDPNNPGKTMAPPVGMDGNPVVGLGATDTGNLAATATAAGAPADTAYAGSGNSSIVAALKGIYAKLGAAVATVSGTVTANLGATDTGNLAATATAAGAPADTAYAGSGNSSIVAALKGIYTKLNAAGLGAGTAIIGKVGIDQTTPGTTNGVQVNAALPAGTNTIGNVGSAPIVTTTATISSGGSLTPSIDLSAGSLARIVIPSSWTSANLTFQTSADNATFNDLYDPTGNEYTVTVGGAARAILVTFGDFYGVRYLKIRSGTTGSAVNQGADRVLTLVLRP